MDIHTFTTLVGETPRQIRFLIAEGFIPPPTGGRARAQYGPVHVAAVKRYRWLRERYAPQQIKLMLSASGPGLRLAVLPGVELLLDPALLDERLDAQRIAERVHQLLLEMPQATTLDRKDGTDAD